MYVTVVPNRGSPPAILLRETYREDGKVKNRTLANLSKWKPEKIAALRAVLRDQPRDDQSQRQHARARDARRHQRVGFDPWVKTDTAGHPQGRGNVAVRQ